MRKRKGAISEALDSILSDIDLLGDIVDTAYDSLFFWSDKPVKRRKRHH